MLTPQILEIVTQVAPSVRSWPRREPGVLVVGGKLLRYADMHSFFHQARQIFGDRLYDFACQEPAPRILDCGAHIGLASLFFKELYPRARIEAFEADAALAELSRANLRSFGADDVKVAQAAVWTHDRGVRFDHSHDDAGHVAETGEAVPSVRLRSLLEERVHLLKLDVEGAEFALIEDCGETLRNAERIIMEVHAMGAEQSPIGPLLARLENLGFRYTLSDLHAATWEPSAAPPPFAFPRAEKFIVSVFAWQP